MIRTPNLNDLDELKKIHEKHYSNEFIFEDFLNNSLSNFIIIDDKDGQIITAGSVRPIAEMVAITNLDKSPRSRRDALYESLQIAQFILQNTNMRQLHVFVQDTKWEEQLKKSGFQQTKGNALYINI